MILNPWQKQVLRGIPIVVFLVFSSAIPAAGVTRIMPLGDSITMGVGSTNFNGYREPLYQALTDADYNFDFVGGQTDGDFPDPDHEGHSGWHADTAGENDILGQVYNWLTANPADIVLLHIGTNDISVGGQNANEVSDILDEIDRFSPDIKVILALIINRRPYSPATSQFNRDVNNMALNRIANGDDIIIVDMESALNYGTDMADGLHPNDSGYTKIAGVWYNALAGCVDRFVSISGHVLEADGNTPVAGVLLDANNNGGNIDVTDANGYYELVVPYGWSGTATPIKEGYTFEPNGRAYNNVLADQDEQDYTGRLLIFTISGRITNECNVPTEGVTVSADNGGNTVATDVNGCYEVWLPNNWSGTVTPSKLYYTFEPADMVYVNVLADVANQDYVADNIYDLDCDGSIGMGDVVVFCDNWLDETAGNICDFNGDLNVNFMDFAEFANAWLTEYEK